MAQATLSWKTLTSETWTDFERLAGPKGMCGGCWCMLHRVMAKEFEAGKGESNKRAMENLAQGRRAPGILAYHEDKAVGWCSVGPRADFPRLANSRVLAPVDGEPVWCITCFFVAKAMRRRGLSKYLIQSACEFAKGEGADLIEAYPTIPKKAAMPDVFACTGLASAFCALGFKTVLQRSETRPIMRRAL